MRSNSVKNEAVWICFGEIVTQFSSFEQGARRSSVVRALAYGAMGRRIDPSLWTHWAISRSSQCPTTGVTKAVVC